MGALLGRYWRGASPARSNQASSCAEGRLDGDGRLHYQGTGKRAKSGTAPPPLCPRPAAQTARNGSKRLCLIGPAVGPAAGSLLAPWQGSCARRAAFLELSVSAVDRRSHSPAFYRCQRAKWQAPATHRPQRRPRSMRLAPRAWWPSRVCYLPDAGVAAFLANAERMFGAHAVNSAFVSRWYSSLKAQGPFFQSQIEALMGDYVTFAAFLEDQFGERAVLSPLFKWCRPPRRRRTTPPASLLAHDCPPFPPRARVGRRPGPHHHKQRGVQDSHHAQARASGALPTGGGGCTTWVMGRRRPWRAPHAHA